MPADHSTPAKPYDVTAPLALRWREYLESAAAAGEYPPPEQIRDIARRLGASV